MAGDRLLMTSKIANLEVKESKGLGTMLVVTSEQTFTDQVSGDVVHAHPRPSHLLLKGTNEHAEVRRCQRGRRAAHPEEVPDRLQLVLYCAGSGDFNPLHWDQSFPQAQAIGDNIVHGRMKYATLGQAFRLGRRRRLGPLGVLPVPGHGHAGHRWLAKGIVTAKREEDGRKLVDIDVWTENADGPEDNAGQGGRRPQRVNGSDDQATAAATSPRSSKLAIIAAWSPVM